jgi:hypothetical protein
VNARISDVTSWRTPVVRLVQTNNSSDGSARLAARDRPLLMDHHALAPRRVAPSTFRLGVGGFCETFPHPNARAHAFQITDCS